MSIRRAGELLKQFDAQGKRSDLELSNGTDTKLSQKEAAQQAGMSKRQQVTAVRVANVDSVYFCYLTTHYNVGGTPNQTMKYRIPIALKREAVRRMAEVESGQLTRAEGEDILKKRAGKNRISRTEMIERLTRSYDEEAAEAFRFFRLL